MAITSVTPMEYQTSREHHTMADAVLVLAGVSHMDCPYMELVNGTWFVTEYLRNSDGKHYATGTGLNAETASRIVTVDP